MTRSPTHANWIALSLGLISAGQIPISAWLHPFGLARHLRVAYLLFIMLSCINARR
jgi:hypothetical protein